jgi:hypothetical protein
VRLSIAASIFGNLFLIFYDPSWFRHLIHAGINGFALYAAWTIFTVFPFEIDPPFYTAFLIATGIAVAGSAIGMIVEAVLAIVGIVRGE